MGKTSSFTWVCDTWNYNVEHKKSVSRHKRLHSIERVMKYSCLKCFKSFDRKVNFSSHEKTCLTRKKSKNQCNVCQKEFEKPWMLQRHMVIHVKKTLLNAMSVVLKSSLLMYKRTQLFVKQLVQHQCTIKRRNCFYGRNWQFFPIADLQCRTWGGGGG